MTNEQKYHQLQNHLQSIEKSTGLYLADMNIDAENVGDAYERHSDEWYGAMLACAKMAAGMRAEEAGQDINKLIGYIIY